MRDLFFTCSSIGFGYEMSAQSKALNISFPGVRLYALNQSMLTPMFKRFGMPYVGTCHDSDTNYLFNGHFPEGEVSESDQVLSRSMTGSFINFAYTGNPEYTGDEHFNSWPESFPKTEGISAQSGSILSEIELLVVGGPLGTGSSRLSRNEGEAKMTTWEGSTQQPLGGDMQYEEMRTARDQQRVRILESEKLLERCAFISSLSEKLGV
jgi:hypothetical protein